MNRPLPWGQLPSGRREKTLPEVLSPEETLLMLNYPEQSLKSKTLLHAAYAGGLRGLRSRSPANRGHRQSAYAYPHPTGKGREGPLRDAVAGNRLTSCASIGKPTAPIDWLFFACMDRSRPLKKRARAAKVQSYP